MERSGPLFQRLFAMALALSLVALVACDSGTPEPKAPAPSDSEYGALQTDAPPKSESAAQIEVPRDGSISPDRFMDDLPQGITAEIPANFPAGLPVYPGAQPAQGRGVELEDGVGMGGVHLLSNDSPAEIYAFYERELASNGWTITQTRSDSSVGAFTLERGGETVELFFMTSPLGGTDIFSVFEKK